MLLNHERMKPLFTVLFLVLMLMSFIPPAQAAFCRQRSGHTICILDIKRSAKNYWEYRATVRIDDRVRPPEIYNCRDRIRVKPDGSTIAFEPDSAGELICSTLK